MRLLFLCVSVLFFEKGVLKVMTASLKARREVLVICEAECYQKRRLHAQSIPFTKIVVLNSRSRVWQISITSQNKVVTLK